MKKLAFLIVAATLVAATGPAHAGGILPIISSLGRGVGSGASAAPVNEVLPGIVGLDTVGSSLSVNTGTWDNSPTSFTYNWHMIGGSSLGTGSTFGPLTSGMVTACSGSTDPACGRLQVDVVATNTAGSSPTVISDFIGPVETTLPTLPAAGAGPAPTALPVYPANFLENGHAVYPGCAVPPAAPTFTTGAHVWYFDSVNGHTATGGATGHLGSPFKDIAAIFNTTTGYGATPLFGNSIAPGDTIYIEPDATGATVGAIAGSDYSTSDGTTTGTVVWTWIAKDPAASLNPVLSGFSMTASAGFMFQGLNIEQISSSTASNGAPMFGMSGSVAAPLHDIVYENGSLSSWVGHSNDPRASTTYPNSGGHSDGTIQTASPYVSKIDPEDPPNNLMSAASGATQMFLTTSIPLIGQYLWSPGYYYQQAFPLFPITAPSNTGIPNGTVVKDIQGHTNLTIGGTVATSASLPATAVLNEAFLALDTKHMWIGNATPAWVDSGLAFITIGGCDAVVDGPTGCPSTLTTNGTNLVGCDPKVGGSGGCGGGTPPVWAGTTRAITATNADAITTTNRMHIAPAGWWNHLDWDYAQGGFAVNGSIVGTSNDIEGGQCVSLKNNTVRWVNSQVVLNLMVNSVAYGNWMMYRAQDAFQVLSSNRIIIANNFSAEASFDRGHPDMIQWAQNGVSSNNAAQFYGDAAVNNEFYTYVDPNDQFPFFTQGIGVTDQVYGFYMADNIIFNSQNPSGTAGEFGVDVQNDQFEDANNSPGSLKVVSGNKANLNVAANSMLSNNVANAVSRNLSVPGVSTNCSVDGNTVGGNVNVSTINMTTGVGAIGNSTYCNTSNGVVNGSVGGVYPDFAGWTPNDFRSGTSNPLFTDYSPIPPIALPAPGGNSDTVNTCIRNEVKFGTCVPGDVGRLDLRPKASFTPSPLTGYAGGQVTQADFLPTTGAIGDQTILVIDSFCSNGQRCAGTGNPFGGIVIPAGIYTRCTNGTTFVAPCLAALPAGSMAAYGSTPPSPGPFNANNKAFTPGIIGAGGNLGINGPPADHGRRPWANPPSAGAYEGATASPATPCSSICLMLRML